MKLTHEGILEGNDARLPSGYKVRVRLRETKCYWITEQKLKFKKPTGYGVGDWPMYSLDIDSIREIKNPRQPEKENGG